MTDSRASRPSTCPICGMWGRPDDLVCSNCGLPIAGSSDPIAGVAAGQTKSTIGGPSNRASITGLVIALSLILVAGTLATSGAGFLRYGGRIGMTPPPMNTYLATTPPVPESRSLVARVVDTGLTSSTDDPEPTSAYSCDDSTFKSAKGRWTIASVRAGTREGRERVTIMLKRSGKAKRAARVMATWMSPAEARKTFGLPRFAGRRGLLLTFAGPVTMDAAQLIGPSDLRDAGISSIGGIYRFIDSEGVNHAFVAILDDSCARIRGPGFQPGESGKGGPRILLDVKRPPAD